MNRHARWVGIVGTVAVIGAALVLAFMISLTGQGEGFYERNFIWLFWLNVAVGAMLLLVIAIAVVRLVLRQRRGKFGTKLLAKLAGIFAVVGLLPGLVIYTVSYQFVSRSIEIWFDVRVATALDAGLALGKGTLEELVVDLGEKTRLAAEKLADERAPMTPLALERLREQMGVRDLALLGPSGQLLISTGSGTSAIAPERPSPAVLRQARSLGVASRIEGLDEEALAGSALQPGARVRALAPVPDLQLLLRPGEERFLLAVQPVPKQLAANALAVQSAYSEYQQRALARSGLRRMYIGTLTLALVLAVFGAVLLAVLLGNQLVRPLILLADGVRQVAKGDLSSKPVFASRDELGGLTRSFADMTAQLSEAREEVQRGVTQLEGARTRLQTILDNLTAGVVVFDREGHIDTVNPGATRILRLPLSVYRGRGLQEVPELGEFAKSVWQRFELHATSPEPGERDHWQEAFELHPGERNTQMLLVRGATLPDVGAQLDDGQQPPAGVAATSGRRAAPGARLMVFDDITEVVSAQRSAAWSEVARRLAHEIKNPLTPIQLSAERLQHKLQHKLDGSDQALLQRSVATIVNQVQAMKQLVNEFRDYARLPAAQLVPLDLNALVVEVLALYGEKQEQGRLAAQLADGLPRVMGDASQLRQVVHNLVQNALDAVADRASGRVRVATSAARGDNGELRAVRLSIIDNGPGFAENVLQRAFEPYITTKSKGTGLGLAVVKKIADEHRATVRIANLHSAADKTVSGARVSLSFSFFMPTPGSAANDGGEQPGAAALGTAQPGPAPANGETTQVH